MIQLKDLCQKASSNIAQKDLEGHEGQYPIYGASGLIGYVDFYKQENPYVAVVKDGAGIGRVMCLPEKSSVIGTMQYILPNEGVNVHYLAFAMEHMNLAKYFSGATIPHIYFKDYGKEKLLERTEKEQKSIAEILNKMDSLISLRKQQIAKLDELVKARFVEMFGDLVAPQCEYPELKLVDICADADDIKCGPFGTQLNKDEYKAKGVAIWEIPQINSGFSEMPTHFITEEKAAILNAYSIEPGDIAMSRKGNVGKCGLFPENLKKGIIHSDVLRIRVDKRKVDSCFMMYQLHFSEAVKRQIEMVSSGAIMAGINVTKLKQIKVRIPELENQRMFAAFVERVDQQKQTVQQSLEKLELMKKALMQEYFG
ncbi:restriction endonuclease subunit S [Faecalibacterium sp. CLA-AA-H283]|jgi:type I restriction enzyme S subunit|uniref:restriction endonuclease subunit S n=1 Tax=Faecalibacterium TaxID=216851 RepID=UPI001D0F0532|nr:restriction endonuclease subunit S [Faecalibacterium hominis (ex Afrizal et al. 2022)]MCC2139264.1 restriction endonuclease subunit S [Faecalibacterium hominis (ex Afrizal et al. 2022)]